jgi:Periplasmic copper-binding protein (NosD)
MRIAALAAVAAAFVLVPAAAQAQNYPAPREPGKVAPKPRGPFETHTVCKRAGRCDFTSIQRAIKAADAGDTIRIRPGTYREGVAIEGRRKSYLKLIGSPRAPGRVVLEGRRARGSNQNGVRVDGADEVTVNGITAKNFRANGFFVVNAVGYTLTNLHASRTGTYGIYAFNSKGGEISDSEASFVNDGAFYIGQTPPQTRPMRTIVRNVDGWGAPIGFSATNMRYVTITKSRFFNNAVGLVPNALDSEQFPPNEGNTIVDNDIFWNNFNFHEGNPPFEKRDEGVAALAPIGTGILLLGGRDHRIENNRIYGNYLAGIAALDGILITRNPQAVSLDRNTIRNNEFGLDGTDLNGREIIYDGSGSDNCFGGNTGLQNTIPAAAALPGCPFSGKNAFSQADRETLVSFTATGALANWIRHPHAPKRGFTPLEVFE